MEDMERYGDYNDPEEEAIPRRKPILMTCLKVLLIVVILLVVGVLGYRLFLFDYYPSEMSTFIRTEHFDAYPAEGDGLPAVMTQKLRFPYDDSDLDARNSNDLGTFFAAHLYVVKQTGELQVTVRVNEAGLSDVAGKFGDTEATAEVVAERLSFRLSDNYGRVYTSLIGVYTAEHAMYRYYKLCFDGIDFVEPADALGAPEWIRLEILYDDEPEPYSYTLVYENNEDFSTLNPYTFTGKEPSYRDY